MNAVDLNPTPGFQQAPSIMTAGLLFTTAYDQVISPQATLAQIGWQDSDGDGIFDVLDVPLELNGVGRLNTVTNEYHFDGFAQAKALPNRNSSGLQSDITLNKVGRVEYRLNNAASWTVAESPNAFQANLNLRIPIPTGTTGTIDIRAIDPRTGITSGVFTGSLSAFDSTSSSGLNGFVWSDTTNDGQRQLTELGLAGWTVQIVNSTGNVVDFQTKVEPDLNPLGILAANAYSGVTLRAVGKLADGTLSVATDSRATTGTKVFVPVDPFSSNELAGWFDDDQNLEARFSNLQSAVSVDVFGLAANTYARLEAYSSSGQLLERVTSTALSNGQSTTLVLNRSIADIQYVVVKGHLNTRIGIDNLRFGAASQTVTGAFGEYKLLGLAPGSYNVRAVPPTGFVATSPTSGTTTVSLVSAQATTHVDFGFWREELAPTVTGVFAASSSWGATFIDAVDGGAIGAGNGLGYALTAGLSLPNAGVDRIYVQFSEPVVGFNASTVALLGVDVADYASVPGLMSVSYDSANRRGVIELSSSLVRDKLRLGGSDAVKDLSLNALDGDANASAGGVMDLRFNVLIGDANNDGSINGGDLPLFATAFNTSTGSTSYNPRADWNANGSVNGGDLPLFAARFNQSLPTAEPAALGFPPAMLPPLDSDSMLAPLIEEIEAFFSQLDEELLVLESSDETQ